MNRAALLERLVRDLRTSLRSARGRRRRALEARLAVMERALRAARAEGTA